MVDNYSLPSLQRVLNLINSENPKAFLTPDNVTLGVPASTTQNGKNTQVMVTAVAGRGRTGNRPYFYDRLDLSTFFQTYLNQPVGPVVVDINGALTSYDLLPRIYQKYGVWLDPGDVINEALNGNTLYTMKTKATSLGWIGTVQFNITRQLQPLSNVLTQLTLPLIAASIYHTDAPHQLLAAINTANNTTLTFNDVSFVELLPVAGHDLSYGEVYMRVAGNPDALLSGYVDILYTRRKTADIYPTIQPTGFAYQSSIPDTTTFLNLVATSNDVILTNTEVALEPLGVEPPFAVLQTTNNALLWEPGNTFGFLMPKIPLPDSILNFNWPGLSSSDIANIYYQQTQLMANLFATGTGLSLVDNPIHVGTAGTVQSGDLYLLDTGTVAADASVAGYNAVVTLSATAANTKYTGSAPVHYNRVDASVAFPSPINLTTLGSISATTTRTILAAINAIISTGIDPTWIVDAPVDITTTSTVFTFMEGQMVFIPGTQMGIILQRPVVSTGNYFVLDSGSYFLLDGGGKLLLDSSPV